jgi:uncharacterized protein with PIN domain
MTERPRFAVDEMLGSLARWLRIMGYDTVYTRDRTDSAILDLAKGDGRFLLTRDRELSKRMGEMGVYVESDDLDEQLRQARSRFQLEANAERSRCTVCNGELEVVPPEKAKGHVPEGVLENHTSFYVCLACGKFYWRGSHWRQISKRLEDL